MVRALSQQVSILADVLDKVKRQNPTAVVDVVCHSQGALIVALACPTGIRRTILLAPPMDKDIDRMIEIFRKRPGTEIDTESVSRITRADGSVTLVPPEYWSERKSIDPVPLYNALAAVTGLTMVVAKQDEVLGSFDHHGLSENVHIIELDGDHSFQGETRKRLLEVVQKLLQ